MEKEKNPWNKNALWEAEIGALKDIIAKTELVEAVKWGGIVYTINNRNVLGIGGFKNYFALWFFNGVFLSDPKNVLVNAGEGVTRALRQWRFASAAEIDEKTIRAYLKEAIANERAGKQIKSESRSKDFAVPELLQQALDQNKLAGAFQRFTRGRQYEFVEYIDSAKLEKTKIARVEKVLPMIAGGVGLNDKYRKS